MTCTERQPNCYGLVLLLELPAPLVHGILTGGTDALVDVEAVLRVCAALVVLGHDVHEPLYHRLSTYKDLDLDRSSPASDYFILALINITSIR